jgi:DNA-binding PadR family transcriptional regulator
LVILNLIAEKPRHGYEIIKAIEEQVGGAYSPSPGVIYPTLTLLEELGHVTVSLGDGAKKSHAITAEGRAYLDAHRSAVDALLARMAEAAAPAPFARSAQRGANQCCGRCNRPRGHQRRTDLMCRNPDKEKFND